MKKISLKSIKQFLSREEMKQINGGSSSDCLDWISCNWNSQCHNPYCNRCVAPGPYHPSGEAGVCAT